MCDDYVFYQACYILFFFVALFLLNAGFYLGGLSVNAFLTTRSEYMGRVRRNVQGT